MRCPCLEQAACVHTETRRTDERDQNERKIITLSIIQNTSKLPVLVFICIKVGNHIQRELYVRFFKTVNSKYTFVLVLAQKYS